MPLLASTTDTLCESMIPSRAGRHWILLETRSLSMVDPYLEKGEHNPELTSFYPLYKLRGCSIGSSPLTGIGWLILKPSYFELEIFFPSPSSHLQRSILSHWITAPPTNQNPGEIVISIIILVSAVWILGIIRILKSRGTECPNQSDRGPGIGCERSYIPQVGGMSIHPILQSRVGEIWGESIFPANLMAISIPLCQTLQVCSLGNSRKAKDGGPYSKEVGLHFP